MSKTQIDRLGDRLRKGVVSDDDLRLLDTYRRDFFDAYEIVVKAIREKLALEPTGRPAKSTTSISDKLRRESIRLSQVQDIAGCRLVVGDIAAQNLAVESLKKLFPDCVIVDRRERSSHGYRAVHVIVNYLGKSIEIQVRTSLQHVWAELSEKFSDVVDPAIKYGGGNKSVQTVLARSSDTTKKQESLEKEQESIEAFLADAVNRMSSTGRLNKSKQRELAEINKKIAEIRKAINDLRQKTVKDLRDIIENLSSQ